MIRAAVRRRSGPLVHLQNWYLWKYRRPVGDARWNSAMADAARLDSQVVAHHDALMLMPPEPGVHSRQQPTGFLEKGAAEHSLVIRREQLMMGHHNRLGAWLV